jgi:ATP-binding protein involved in chromosome partitioning
MKGYFDIAGDGGSGVLEQVTAQRRRIAEALAGVAHRVAIGSGKGGVGKSTLTIQLAEALRARGLEIALLDADLNGPSLARLAGVRPVAQSPGRTVLPRSDSGIAVFSMGTILAEAAFLDFESVAEGESHTWRATREFALLAQVLESVEWGRRDVLLVDLPPGAERTLQYAEFLGPEVAFVLVTVPSELSREVVRRSANALARTPNRVFGYVENMSGYYCAECDEVKPLFPSPRTADLGVPKLAAVPFDPELAQLSDAGRSALAQGSPAAVAIGELAARLVALLEEQP